MGSALKPLKNFSKQALTASREVGLQLGSFSKRHFFLGINCQWLEIIGMLSTKKLTIILFSTVLIG